MFDQGAEEGGVFPRLTRYGRGKINPACGYFLRFQGVRIQSQDFSLTVPFIGPDGD